MRNCFYFILSRNQFIAKYWPKYFLRIENIIAVKLLNFFPMGEVGA